jgi:hypothetical protein
MGKKLLDHLVETITAERGYSSLFKAGVFLVAAAMIALSETGTFLYDKDLAAHKAAFSIEATIGKPVDQTTDCFKLDKAFVADCRIAVHALRTLNSSLRLFFRIIQICLGFGLFLVGMSILGFLVAPFLKPPGPQP